MKFLTDWKTAFLSKTSLSECLFCWCSTPAALLKLLIVPSEEIGSLNMASLVSGLLKNLLPSTSDFSRLTPKIILWSAPISS